MHHINMNPAIITVFNMFKSFMKEKMRKRVSQLQSWVYRNFNNCGNLGPYAVIIWLNVKGKVIHMLH